MEKLSGVQAEKENNRYDDTGRPSSVSGSGQGYYLAKSNNNEQKKQRWPGKDFIPVAKERIVDLEYLNFFLKDINSNVQK